MARQKKLGLTPYQGNMRCFGQFTCPNCKRSWMSGTSWADMGQDCLVCDIRVYPHIQRKLQKSKKNLDKLNKAIPHLESHCEKCEQLGYCCRKIFIGK